MQITDLKQIETGHYVIYSVRNVYGFYKHDPTLRSIVAIPFKDEKSADKASTFLNTTYYPYHTSLKLKSRVVKEVCVFDGDCFHAVSGYRWNFDEIKSTDRINQYEDIGKIPYLSPYGKALLKWLGAPLLKRRNCCLQFFCFVSLLCCCFGCYDNVSEG